MWKERPHRSKANKTNDGNHFQYKHRELRTTTPGPSPTTSACCTWRSPLTSAASTSAPSVQMEFRIKIFANTEKIFVQVCPPAARSTPPATCAPSPAGEPPPREAPSPGSSRRWRKYLQTTRKIFVLIQKIFQVDVPVVSDDDCRDSYGQNDIADSMICAGLDAGGKDSCQVKLFLEWFVKYLCAKCL